MASTIFLWIFCSIRVKIIIAVRQLLEKYSVSFIQFQAKICQDWKIMISLCSNHSSKPTAELRVVIHVQNSQIIHSKFKILLVFLKIEYLDTIWDFLTVCVDCWWQIDFSVHLFLRLFRFATRAKLDLTAIITSLSLSFLQSSFQVFTTLARFLLCLDRCGQL